MIDKCFMTFVTRMLGGEHYNPIFSEYFEKMAVLTVLFLTGISVMNGFQ